MIIISGMTKRAASYDIDPVTYEEKERENEGSSAIDPEGSHMRNRKYLCDEEESLSLLARRVRASLQPKPDRYSTSRA